MLTVSLKLLLQKEDNKDVSIAIEFADRGED